MAGRRALRKLRIPVVLLCCTFGSATARAGPLVVGHDAAEGNPPIETFDYASGAQVGVFVSDGGLSPAANGRGVEVVGNEVFYTEVAFDGAGIGPLDAFIHVAPFNLGAGGSDLRLLPSPRPDAGIQDLDYFGGALYALTGYSHFAPPTVYQLDPLTGAVLNSVTLLGPDPGADGFTVLPNGNFLVNDFDTSHIYREYDGTGLQTGFSLDLSAIDTDPILATTGVDEFDGSLYFSAFSLDLSQQPQIPSNHRIIHTDYLGNLLDATFIVPSGLAFEDISVIPEPSTFALLGGGLAALGALSTRRRGRAGRGHEVSRSVE